MQPKRGWRIAAAAKGRAFAVGLIVALFALGNTAFADDGWSRIATRLLQPVAVESELPNSGVPMTMTSDGSGFLWVGTQNGLARWDGQQFKLYTAGSTPQSLPDSQVETLHLDTRGRLWIGMLSAGVARFDPQTGAIHRYLDRNGRSSFAGVAALEDAPNGDLWVGADDGLYVLSPDSGRMHEIRAAPALQAMLDSGVNALASSRGALWIATSQGLLRRDAATGEIRLIPLGRKTHPLVDALLMDAQGRLWVATDGAGALVVDTASGAVRPIPGSMRAGLLGDGMRVRALLQLSPHEVWLGTYDDGVIAVDTDTLRSRRMRLGDGALLYGDQNIRALYKAPGGQVFIAANSAITRYDPRHLAFETILGGAAPTAVLAERTPVALSPGPKGRVWVGYIGRGVDILDPSTGKLIHRPPGPGGLPDGPVRSMAPLKDAMLVGMNAGLYRLDADGLHARRIEQPGRTTTTDAYALLSDGPRLWVGGQGGLWTYRIGPDGGLTADPQPPRGELSDRRVSVIARDHDGGVWIGTNRGLNAYDPNTNRLTALEPAANDDATPTGFISSITQDSHGRLWVTTFGRGVSVADSPAAARAHRFRRLDVVDGLPNSNTNSVLEDAHGGVWVSTDGGLARVDGRSLKVEALQLPQGVAVASFFYNAALRAGHDLLFAGRGGLQVVHPDLFSHDAEHPPLRITEIRERGKVLAGDPLLKLAPGEALRLPPGGGALEVGFAALDYGAPDRVRYAYRLLGQTTAWTEVDAHRRLAALGALNPGRYVLQIRASSPDQSWAPQVVELPLQVAPAWNQTWWFHLAEVIASVLVVVALVRWRTAHLAGRQRVLEQQVEERTHELQSQKDTLEAQAVELAKARTHAEHLAQAKSDFLANMSHEIRTPLNGVVAVADMLARSALPERERDMAEIIRASGDTLQRLLSDILDMARIESGQITIETAPFHAGAMVRAVCGLSQLKCDEKGVRLTVEIAPEIDEMVDGDMVRVRQVVTNLLSNAVKFTDKGEVRLVAERLADGRARFAVSDTGVGFDMADKGKVLGRFQQADSSITRRFGGTGLGLSICCNLAELMGGVLDCSSQPGVGSTFWMELPLAPASQGADAGEAGSAPLGLCMGANDEGAGGEDQPALRVLVADDHPTNRQVVRLMLDGMAELTCVEDGAQAVAAFEQQPYDVILMDMQMPVMDGLSALQEIRRREAAKGLARTPAVMLTANALPEHVASALAAGADLHLSKPFTAPGLFQAIEDALDGRGAEAAAA